MDKLTAQLKIHEGYRRRVYLCSRGKPTVGYGYNLSANPLHLSTLEINYAFTNGMNEHEASRLLALMIGKCITQLEDSLTFFHKLNPARQDCLINMCFNLGWVGLMKFKKFLLLAEAGEYSQASIEMLNSKWAKEDVPARALELSTQMKTGEYA
jgi:lysozyme